jgi:hypothetical protein
VKALCLIGLQITDFNHKEHKDHKGLAKVIQFLIAQ